MIDGMSEKEAREVREQRIALVGTLHAEADEETRQRVELMRQRLRGRAVAMVKGGEVEHAEAMMAIMLAACDIALDDMEAMAEAEPPGA